MEAGVQLTMELSLVAEMEALVVAGKHQSRRLEIWGNPVLLIPAVEAEAVMVLDLSSVALEDQESLLFVLLLLIVVRALWLLLVELKQRSLVMVLMVI